jgi:hypothetical protein
MMEAYFLVKVRQLEGTGVTRGIILNAITSLMEDMNVEGMTVETLDTQPMAADPLTRLRASMDSSVPNPDYEDVEAVMNELTVARSQATAMHKRLERVDELITKLLDV